MLPRIKGPPEGKRPAKVFKESLEIQNQRFSELIEKMDVMGKRYKDHDRRFQQQDQRFEPREKSVEMKEDLGRNSATGGLTGQQARPQGEDA